MQIFLNLCWLQYAEGYKKKPKVTFFSGLWANFLVGVGPEVTQGGGVRGFGGPPIPPVPMYGRAKKHAAVIGGSKKSLLRTEGQKFRKNDQKNREFCVKIMCRRP